MDHSKKDHSMPHHGGDMDGMPGMGDDMCSMNMLFNWDTTNLCIVFRSWHIRSTFHLLASLVAIVFFVAGYEALRSFTHRFSASADMRGEILTTESLTETTTLLEVGRIKTGVSRRAHVLKSLLYAAQTFYAFIIMLIFMTYNGYIMGAVAIGAFVGYLAFGGRTEATKETACH